MVLTLSPAVVSAEIKVDYLRTEYRVTPLGIGVTNPRLSWELQSAERGQGQTAYRVLVADSRKALDADQGNLWDSGKVTSDDSTAVVYAGRPLRSGMQAVWKVKVWDKSHGPQPWSRPAMWSMGLLKPEDWKAQWIGLDEIADSSAGEAAGQAVAKAFETARWIWLPGGKPAAEAAVGTVCFRRTVVLPGDQVVAAADLAIAADNEATIFVNGERLVMIRGKTAGRRLSLLGQLHPGVNTVAVEVRNVGDAANPAGLIAALRVVSEGSPELIITTDNHWLATEEPKEDWPAGDHDTALWVAAKPFGPNGMAPWGKVTAPILHLPPARYLRTEFTLSRPIRRATVYASALGLYQLQINGQRVGNDYFAPGWTDYDKRVYYDTYDVTQLLAQGPNAVGGIIADGWYAGYVGFGGERDHYGSKLRLFAQLCVEYTDGTTETIATGPDWRANTGPIREADFLMGERYDARREMPAWSRSGFDASAWHAVAITDHVAAQIEARPGPTIQALEPIEPIAITEPKPGRFVLNLGQNFAGIEQLKVVGAKPGQVITLRFAEMVNPDGTVYTDNMRSALATDTYICRGTGEVEVWRPQFTFHGFQYVELAGYPGRPDKQTVIGIPLSSDTPVVGHFECSDPMLNKLMSNIYWTQRANFIDIPTDCPQRDERLGWTGDAQIYVRTASMLADTHAFFAKWLVDLDDAQRADGQYPMVAPLKSKGVSADGGPAWADAGVICPWTIYDVFDDRRLLAQHYPQMIRLIAFCKNRCTSDLLPPETFHCFGDWLSIKADTPKDVIFTAYFAHSTKLVARAAKALGKTDDAARYERLFEQIKAAFNKAYVAADGRIKGNTQTCYVLALAFDLVDGENQKRAAQYLIDDIRQRDWHLSTGFIGTKDLMLVLTKIGRTDVAYRLLHNTTFPSWGFSIEQGATSIWERWNGWTPEHGFFDPGMNSFAHYSFGAVAQWVFETVGGINNQTPGFRKIVIHPRPGGKLRWARTRYRSIHGEIRTAWKRTGDQLQLDVTIPTGTTATVYVPSRKGAEVTEGGQPANESAGVRPVRNTADAAVYQVGSGSYRFQSNMPAQP